MQQYFNVVSYVHIGIKKDEELGYYIPKTFLIEKHEYVHAKQEAKDVVYKVEQLWKEIVGDAITKHVKAAEDIASNFTGLSDEDIYNIIKITVGMLNENKA